MIVQTVALIAILGGGLLATSEDFWLWLMPGRLLYDCSKLTPEQQATVRTNGLAGIGILGKCK